MAFYHIPVNDMDSNEATDTDRLHKVISHTRAEIHIKPYQHTMPKIHISRIARVETGFERIQRIQAFSLIDGA